MSERRDTHHHLAAAWLASFASTNTQAAYRRDLERFSAWCGGSGRIVLRATAADVAGYRQASEGEGASAATVARRLSALSSFFEFAVDQGEVGENPVGARPSVERLASATVGLTAAQLADVLGAARQEGARELALVALLVHHGLKLNEVLAIDAEHLHGRPPTAVTIVSRRPASDVRLAPPVSAALRRLLGARRHGPLLQAEHAGGDGTRLTRFGADYLLRATGRRAGLAFPLTTNVLRRTHVELAHESGEDVDDLRERLGHRDSRTTRRYLAARATSTPIRSSTQHPTDTPTHTSDHAPDGEEPSGTRR